MKFKFSSEQKDFREFVRKFLESNSDTSKVRRAMESESGWDEAVWRQLCAEMEVPATCIPEEYGGHGFGVAELSILSEEMGRALYCGPFFGSVVMATTAIVESATEDAKAELLPKLAQGRSIAALAIAEASGSWRAEDVTAVASETHDSWVLIGEKSFVVDGMSADLLVVVARTGNGVSMFAVEASADGVTREALETLDPTRRLAKITFANAPARLISGDQPAEGAINRALDSVLVCLANEMVGGAERLLESAVEYSKVRIQFGRQIGSFQSLKHKTADMFTDIELAKSAAYTMASAIDDGDENIPAYASMAKATASEAFMQAAAHTVQIHGGIGFTWENDTHLWFKRAKSNEVFLGRNALHRERMVAELGL